MMSVGRFNEQEDYTRSKFCIDVECRDGQLLYNTLSGELLLIESPDEYELQRKALVERHFLVLKGFDESSYMRQIKDILTLLRQPKNAVTTYKILTTTDCNARCFYCYEHGLTRKSMNEQVAHDTANHIAAASKGKSVFIHWFGGEPLYNKTAIAIIAEELSLHGVPFNSIITTNGFYLDADTALKAVQDWHIQSAHITIDGTKDVYNRTKAFVDGIDNSYDRVLTNIDNALNQGIEIFIRLNMDAANADDLFQVCEELAERFEGRKNLHMAVAPLAPLKNKIHSFETGDELVQHFIDLTERIESYGLAPNWSLPRKVMLNRCLADSRSAEVILPDGQVAKCEHFDETEYIGDIYSPWRDEALVASWAEAATPYPQCVNCPIRPLCMPLVRCEWDARGCSKAKREMRIYKYKKRMLAEYSRYRRTHDGAQ